MKLAAIALFVVSARASEVSDCRPCVFQLSPNGPKLSFTFELKRDGDERTVTAIQVQGGQRLEVTAEMMGVGADEKFFFGGFDLDFDGVLDLMLITQRGVANASAQYWHYNPRTGQFRSLGEYPVFTADTARKRLKTHVRGGWAGLEFEDGEYVLQGGKLVLMRQVTQSPASVPDVYLRVTRERTARVEAWSPA